MQNSLVYFWALWALREIEAKFTGVLLGPLGSRGDLGKIQWCTFRPSGRLKQNELVYFWALWALREIEAKFTGVVLGPSLRKLSPGALWALREILRP